MKLRDRLRFRPASRIPRSTRLKPVTGEMFALLTVLFTVRSHVPPGLDFRLRFYIERAIWAGVSQPPVSDNSRRSSIRSKTVYGARHLSPSYGHCKGTLEYSFAIVTGAGMGADKSEVLQGTLDLMILKNAGCPGPSSRLWDCAAYRASERGRADTE
jgi:hypothetical protein